MKKQFNKEVALKEISLLEEYIEFCKETKQGYELFLAKFAKTNAETGHLKNMGIVTIKDLKVLGKREYMAGDAIKVIKQRIKRES